eukprot:CAMPEP_0179066168 /NCGR_PEP_ID=MMETSP0796-20121207/28839_1 /TAXON_ID=73915 /ORGANISM="Pyrodinium bahamense, Strain pbaha01" /LENGTH=287 /DNA_ID=CAMNT_0020763167 /DNA_START=69 /DNA_END=932 /DNA_ORIENTATION=-
MPIIKEEPLTKYDPSTFSFKHVKGEVSEAMQEDWRHDKVDDAKKRAIYDCKNYDEFKQRVAGCTLKPIHRNEFNAPPKFAFNRQANPSTGSDRALMSQGAQEGARAQLAVAEHGVRTIRSGREFERELRRCSAQQDKVALLHQLGEDDFARLFGRELDAEVLRQLIVALDETAGTAHAPPGVARRFLLTLATRCPSSTTTAASFLTAGERTMVARLLARESGPEDTGTCCDVRICAALCVPPSMVAAAVASAGESTVIASASSGDDHAVVAHHRDNVIGHGGCDTLD